MELMFPATQTALAPPAAVPSLADIVREKTQGGRLIVRFFLSTMEGEFEDARIHHRVDAAKQLVILQHNSSFSDVVRDETDNGDRIINFLFSVMMGEIEGACSTTGTKPESSSPGSTQTWREPSPKTTPPVVPVKSLPYSIRGGNPSPALHATGAPLHTGAVGAAGVGTALDEIVRTGDQRRQGHRPLLRRRHARRPHRLQDRTRGWTPPISS